MIIRLVKMTVHPERIAEFERTYADVKAFVRAARGCRSLNLLRDINHAGVFFTWSLWDDEKALEDYKNSETYRFVWPRLKAHFAGKAQAWSVSRKDGDSLNHLKD